MNENKSTEKVCYRVIAETAFLEDCGKYHTYGLRAEEKRSNRRILAEVIYDITTNRRKAKQMARLFNKHQVAVVHFQDVVEDMLP